ncbi:MAG: YbaB/EbfC family nucleoid-associated protein [Candidatus Phytoplasma sp.]|nr:YbaB/EbfC family nucleoid-associated protein [Phytoplasma sp.]
MNPSMLNKLRKMQKEMEEAQERLDAAEYIGKASGVTVVMQGTRQILDVKIDSEMAEDLEMLQDAVMIAVNDALSQIENAQQETMGQFTGGMGGFGF